MLQSTYLFWPGSYFFVGPCGSNNVLARMCYEFFRPVRDYSVVMKAVTLEHGKDLSILHFFDNAAENVEKPFVFVLVRLGLKTKRAVRGVG